MKNFFLAITCISMALAASSQGKIVWLGVDFSHAKLIGEFAQFGGAGEKSTSEVQQTYFPAWNMLFVNEQDKYDVKKAVHADEVFFDLDDIKAKNAAVPNKELSSYNAPSPFTKEEIQKFVKGYKSSQKDGKAAAFIVETFNKGEKAAWVDFVLIDLKTKQVIVTDRFKGEPSGFGIRNYWAGALAHIIKQVEKKKYKL